MRPGARIDQAIEALRSEGDAGCCRRCAADRQNGQFVDASDDHCGTRAAWLVAAGSCQPRRHHEAVDALLPDGPDKTYALRKHREVAMWTNIAITRQPDGSPRA